MDFGEYLKRKPIALALRGRFVAPRACLAVIVMTVSATCSPRSDVFRVDVAEESGANTQEYRPPSSLHIVEIGTSVSLDDHGTGWIRRKAPLLPGAKLTLRLNKPEADGFRIHAPLLGETVVPAGESGRVEVLVLPKSSPLFLSHEQLTTLIEQRLGGKVDNLAGSESSVLQGGTIKHEIKSTSVIEGIMADLVHEYHASSGEIRKRIDKWIESAGVGADTRQRAVAAIIARDLDRAESLLREGASTDLMLLGDGSVDAEDYVRAERAYRDALSISGAMNQPTHIHYWRLKQKLAYVLYLEGWQAGARDAESKLREAVGILREDYSPIRQDLSEVEVASTGSLLTGAYGRLASITTGNEKELNLGLAINSAKAALQTFPHNKSGEPDGRYVDSWANLRQNLAIYELRSATEFASTNDLLLQEAERLLEDTIQSLLASKRSDLVANVHRTLSIALWFRAKARTGEDAVKFMERSVAAARAAVNASSEADSPATLADSNHMLGTAAGDLGTMVPEEKAMEYFSESITAYEKALQIRAKEPDKSEWLNADFAIAATYRDAAGKCRDPVLKMNYVAKAVAAYTAAHERYNPATETEQWAGVQETVSYALLQLAPVAAPEQLKDILELARNASNTAATVYGAKEHDERWARARFSVGLILCKLGTLQAAAPAPEPLDEAAAACRDALSILTKDKYPGEWADCYWVLGDIFQAKARPAEVSEKRRLLEDARDNYSRAAEVPSTPDKDPNWEWHQGHHFTCFEALADQVEGKERLEYLTRAVQIARQVTGLIDRHRDTKTWARWQNTLSTTLFSLGQATESGKAADEAYVEAVTAAQSSLGVLTAEADPAGWAKGQANLGYALSALAKAQSNEVDQIALLERAVDAYRNALTVRTRLADPANWSRTKYSCLGALMDLWNLQGSSKPERISEVISGYRELRDVATREKDPQLWANTTEVLADMYRTRAEERASNQRDDLEAAVTEYRALSSFYTVEKQPREWARTKGYLGDTLRRLVPFVPESQINSYLREARVCLNESLRIAQRLGTSEELALLHDALKELKASEQKRVRGKTSGTVKRL